MHPGGSIPAPSRRSLRCVSDRGFSSAELRSSNSAVTDSPFRRLPTPVSVSQPELPTRMKLVQAVSHRLPWFNVAAGVLVVLLQRTPALRAILEVRDHGVTARAGEILRAVFTVATLGAMQSRAGATTFRPSAPSPVQGTVGQSLQYGFTYTGTPSVPAVWQVSGTLPPGLSYSPAPIAGSIRSASPVITGTPTTAGSFTITVQAFNAQGLTNNVRHQIVFQIGGGAAVAPSISAQPQSQTVVAGASVTFSVTATGTPAPTYQWTFNGAPIPGATSATLSLTNVQAANAGSYAVNVSNSAVTAPVASAAATLTVNPAGGPAPVIVAPPLSVTAAAGGTAALSVVATGTGNTYQWRRAGADIAGATDATLILRNVSAANAGAYTVAVGAGGAPVTSASGTLTVASGEARLANLSVRTNLAANARLIVGFSTTGEKNVLLRGIGPTLGVFGVGGAHPDPRLELFNSSAAMIGGNNDWGGGAALSSAFSLVGAFALTTTSRDAALQSVISGAHSVHATGASAGVVLVEVYDAGAGNAVRLNNVSARNIVGTGDDILIAGFVVEGTVAKTLLIRAVGPTLASFGVGGTLADPKLEIYSGATKIVENDNWSAAIGGTFGSVGAFPLVNGSRDAALVISLMPGAYSAQVSGVAGGTGEALVEVYEIP